MVKWGDNIIKYLNKTIQVFVLSKCSVLYLLWLGEGKILKISYMKDVVAEYFSILTAHFLNLDRYYIKIKFRITHNWLPNFLKNKHSVSINGFNVYKTSTLKGYIRQMIN